MAQNHRNTLTPKVASSYRSCSTCGGFYTFTAFIPDFNYFTRFKMPPVKKPKAQKIEKQSTPKKTIDKTKDVVSGQVSTPQKQLFLVVDNRKLHPF